MSAQAATAATAAVLGPFERWLSLWVVACIAAGVALGQFLPGLFQALGRLYCRVFHDAISRPVEGKYRCWKCLREFELKW